MEYRYLGRSGFRVPVLSFGTGTFGGSGALFSAWGSTDVAQARRLVDICLDAGLNMFDSADVYSKGAAEEILGEAIKGRPRDSLIISTKATFRFGEGENQVGSSRYHLLRAVEGERRAPAACEHGVLVAEKAEDARAPGDGDDVRSGFVEVEGDALFAQRRGEKEAKKASRDRGGRGRDASDRGHRGSAPSRLRVRWNGHGSRAWWFRASLPARRSRNARSAALSFCLGISGTCLDQGPCLR